MELWKGDQLVAKGAGSRSKLLLDESFGPGRSFDCYYFPHVTMSPPALFEHLAGTALSEFFDRSDLVLRDGTIRGLRYVHGKSEVMRGASRVGTILLVTPESVPNEAHLWLTYLPAIYKKFLSIPDSDREHVD